MSDLHDAALRAAVWSVIAARAKELADDAKAELAAALEVGDTVAGRWGGHIIGKASKVSGRARLVVHDEEAYTRWVEDRHPSEIVRQVNPAFTGALEARAKSMGLGAVIDSDGEVVPGVSIVETAPYVSVRKGRNAVEVVGQLLASGGLTLDAAAPAELPEAGS